MGELVDELSGAVVSLWSCSITFRHHQSVLGHDRLKRVTDAALHLDAVLHLVDGHAVDTVHNRLEELSEHAFTEVRLDHDSLHVLLLGDVSQALERGLPVFPQSRRS